MLLRVQKRREDASHSQSSAKQSRRLLDFALPARRGGKCFWSAAVLRRFGFHVRVYYFTWDLGFGIWDLFFWQRPWSKIIQQN